MPVEEPLSCPGLPPMTNLLLTKPSERKKTDRRHSNPNGVKVSTCITAYLGDVPQSVRQDLSVSFHQLHVSFITSTLLLKENEQSEAAASRQRRLFTKQNLEFIFIFLLI